MLVELRQAQEPLDYYRLQGQLFRDLYEAQELQAEHSRNAKREMHGKHVERPPLGSWELERAVSDRVVRQLRGVGDALAWHLFGFDRRYLYALSQNDPVSPMVGKDGLAYELGTVVQIWEERGEVALLHDLTNSIRIGDLTIFSADGPRLHEVKSGPKGPTKAQRARMARAEAVLNGERLPIGPDMPGEIWRSSTPFETHLEAFGSALSRADEAGSSALAVGSQWIVSCLSLASPQLSKDLDGALAPWLNPEEAVATARLNDASLFLRGTRPTDRVGVSPGSAPFTIYPFDAPTCARLLCDYVIFETVIGWDRIANALEDEGFAVDFPGDPESTDLAPNEMPVFAVTDGRGRLVIPGSGLQQVLYEFLDPRAYAAAVAEFFRVAEKGRRVEFFLTFADEARVWR